MKGESAICPMICERMGWDPRARPKKKKRGGGRCIMSSFCLASSLFLMHLVYRPRRTRKILVNTFFFLATFMSYRCWSSSTKHKNNNAIIREEGELLCLAFTAVVVPDSAGILPAAERVQPNLRQYQVSLRASLHPAGNSPTIATISIRTTLHTSDR